PESAGVGTLRPPESEKLPLRCELLNAIHCRVRRIDVAGTIKGHELRPSETSAGCLATAKLSRLFAKLAPLANEFPVRREFLDAAVPLIRHIEQAVRPERHGPRKLKLSVPRAFHAPFPQELSRRRIGCH